MTKPFHREELVARYSRHHSAVQGALSVGDQNGPCDG